MRKGLRFFVVIVLCVSLLTGCCLSHDWREATCEEPQLCIECGKTKGEALGHEWQDATCEQPKTCAVCDETKGEALGHEWEADVCKVCGAPKDDVLCRDDYTASDSALAKNADEVVAVMGNHELTNSELQLYYQNCIYTFYSQNYYYLSVLGIDPAAPLHEQQSAVQENMSWEQYFLNAALEEWKAYAALEIMAEEDGFEVSQEVAEQIQQMPQQLEFMAETYGYENVQAYMEDAMAPGMDVDTYLQFNSSYLIANEYVLYFYQTYVPTAQEVEAYAQENAETLLEKGISQDMGLMGSVRHILIQPQGGYMDASGLTTYSDDEWAAAEAEAQRVLQEWTSGAATEESFAELVPTYSADGGSLQTGGLYENICDDGTYVPEFTAWAVDPDRQAGDTGIVKTNYGYHIMYFVRGEDYFSYAVEQTMLAERFRNRQAQVLEGNPLEVDFRQIALVEKTLEG